MRSRKYAPHLVTISETATMSVSKEKESPISQAQQVIPSTRSCAARIERSHSAPPEAEAKDRRMATTGLPRARSQSAKCLSTSSLKPDTATRARPGSTKDKALTSTKVVHKNNSRYGRSRLHNAVRKGDKQAIKTLLETQPDLLWSTDTRGNHPLHYAASPNVPDGATIVYMLLKAGASVNALNNREQTPLLISVISNEDDNDKVARVLLYYHAKPMIKVTDDFMLAQYASSRKLYKITAAIREYMHDLEWRGGFRDLVFIREENH